VEETLELKQKKYNGSKETKKKENENDSLFALADCYSA